MATTDKRPLEEGADRCRESPLRRACREGRLAHQLEEYLAACRAPSEEAGNKKDGARFPNAAGFCRFMGAGLSELEELAEEYPRDCELLWTALEDEALNSPLSPTLLSAYLKTRLGYERRHGEKGGGREDGQLTVCFEHDVLEDGQ